MLWILDILSKLQDRRIRRNKYNIKHNTYLGSVSIYFILISNYPKPKVIIFQIETIPIINQYDSEDFDQKPVNDI